MISEWRQEQDVRLQLLKISYFKKKLILLNNVNVVIITLMQMFRSYSEVLLTQNKTFLEMVFTYHVSLMTQMYYYLNNNFKTTTAL